MSLPDDAQRIGTAPLENELWSRRLAAVVYDDDLDAWRGALFGQRTQTVVEWKPIIVNSNDNAKGRTRGSAPGMLHTPLAYRFRMSVQKSDFW